GVATGRPFSAPKGQTRRTLNPAYQGCKPAGPRLGASTCAKSAKGRCPVAARPISQQHGVGRTTMKQVQFNRFGVPHEVAQYAEVPDIGAPGPDEVVFEVLAFPINPADLSLFTGRYAAKPPLPATPGAECIGRVMAVGANVKHVKPGDHVINMLRENWTQRRKVPAASAIKVRDDIDVQQAAMLRI